MLRYLVILMVLGTSCPSWSARSDSLAERSFVVTFSLRKIPAGNAERAAACERVVKFARNYLRAYRVVRPELKKVIPLGNESYNLVYTSRFEAQAAMRTMPRACAALLQGSDIDILVSPNEPVFSDEQERGVPER